MLILLFAASLELLEPALLLLSESLARIYRIVIQKYRLRRLDLVSARNWGIRRRSLKDTVRLLAHVELVHHFLLFVIVHIFNLDVGLFLIGHRLSLSLAPGGTLLFLGPRPVWQIAVSRLGFREAHFLTPLFRVVAVITVFVLLIRRELHPISLVFDLLALLRIQLVVMVDLSIHGFECTSVLIIDPRTFLQEGRRVLIRIIFLFRARGNHRHVLLLDFRLIIEFV